jgi:hypothetical protein
MIKSATGGGVVRPRTEPLEPWALGGSRGEGRGTLEEEVEEKVGLRLKKGRVAHNYLTLLK